MSDRLDDLLRGVPSLKASAGDDAPAWEAFPEGSGSLRVPRASMPQIKSAHRGAMVQYLKGRGIAHSQESIAPRALKPSQAEFSRAKVARARGFKGPQRSLLISADDHVLDGHHQWLAGLEDAPDAPVTSSEGKRAGVSFGRSTIFAGIKGGSQAGADSPRPASA